MGRSEIGQGNGLGYLDYLSLAAHAEFGKVTAFGLMEIWYLAKSRRVAGMAVWQTIRGWDPDSPPREENGSTMRFEPGAAWETTYLRATKVEYEDEILLARCHP